MPFWVRAQARRASRLIWNLVDPFRWQHAFYNFNTFIAPWPAAASCPGPASCSSSWRPTDRFNRGATPPVWRSSMARASIVEVARCASRADEPVQCPSVTHRSEVRIP